MGHLSIQLVCFGSPLHLQVNANELTNGVINAAFMLLFKDAIRLFAAYNEGIINLLGKYFCLLALKRHWPAKPKSLLPYHRNHGAALMQRHLCTLSFWVDTVSLASNFFTQLTISLLHAIRLT